MTDFKQLCADRFSARKYTDEPVSQADLDYIMECVRLAPSAVNRQPWLFLVVKSDESKAKLQQCYNRNWFATAPLYIIACKNKKVEWVRPYDQKPHGDIDLAIAIEHLCLAATERGLGTCWVCNYDTNLIAELFPMEEGLEPVAIIPLGHIASDCPTKPKERKLLEQIIFKK